MRSLGKKIRDARLDKGLSQTELAENLVTPSMISQIESDRAHPSEKVLRTIAERLEVPIDVLIAEEKEHTELIADHMAAQSYMKAEQYQEAINSLTEILPLTVNIPSMHATILCDLAECYTFLQQYNEAIDSLESALRQFENTDDITGVIKSLNLLGAIQYRQLNYVFARHYWKRAFDQLCQLNDRDPFLEAKILANLGSVHYQLTEYKEAVKYYHQAHEKLKGTEQLSVVANIYRGLGLAYKRNGDCEWAIKYSQRAIIIYEELQNIKLTIDTQKNYAILIGEQGQLDEALHILYQCLSQYDKHGYKEDVCAVQSELARVYVSKQDYTKAQSLCEEALQSPQCSESEKAYIYRTMADIDLQQDKLQDALAQMELSVAIFEKYRIITELPKSYSFISRIYERLGDFQSANKFLHKMQQHVEGSLRERGVNI